MELYREPEIRISVSFKLTGQVHDPHYYMDIFQERVGQSAYVTSGAIECPDDARESYALCKIELRAVKLIY